MVLMMVWQGGWTALSMAKKTLKSKLIFKGDYQALVHSGEIVLIVVRQGGWTT
jgi:hypothetical protein